MSKILSFIKPGVVTGNDVQKMFSIAKLNNFAFPAVNCINTDSINAVLETASKIRAPVIIQFSNGGASFISGKSLKNKNQEAAVLGAISGAYHVHNIAKYYQIPVILHTDHCSRKLLPWIDGLLEADEKHYRKIGKTLFSSYMIDLSNDFLNENIKICCDYLKRMSKIDMTLEIELGCTGGEEDGVNNTKLNSSALYTKPEDISYAYEKLHMISPNFTIAASFGNVHGVYKPGNINLKPKILYNSQNYVSKKFNLPKNPLNFVFHGGSGSTLKDIKEAISYGVIKVNIDTDIQWASWIGVLDYYKKNKKYLQNQLGNPNGLDIPNKKYYDPRVWLRKGQESIITRLEKTFNDLNCIDVI
ncbi:Fructose-bisphosphate aldolase class 2 [Candidatus Providencia siddallii]|uniref:Fructose-bisphosphate aldolase n=1 Tax=Candidatus Providencia siddallii TaxID=1715285 RepID=A0A0M6W870_9GAMM|nr:Fructose-bisphosphate aldolase class 2 [Candidatus Providencia siddallii]